MIRALLKAFQWLDTRFPAKELTVRERLLTLEGERTIIINNQLQDRQTLHGEIGHRINERKEWQSCVDYQRDKILKLEEAVAAIKDLLAKNGNLQIRTEKEKLRQDFVDDPSRFNFIHGKENGK